MRELAQKARERRLSGNHHDDGNLLGFCFDNSYVLYNLLKKEEYSPKIVCGASSRYSEEVLKNYDIEELESVEDLAGYEHYWVEADGLVVDIASDIPQNLGEIIIKTQVPDEYHRLADSYDYACEILKSARYRRCGYCGGRLRYCQCPKQDKLL
jgi:hypothetical protein